MMRRITSSFAGRPVAARVAAAVVAAACLAGAAAAALSAGTPETRMHAQGSLPRPLPPQRPCTFPAGEELAALAARSGAVAVVRVDDAHTTWHPAPPRSPQTDYAVTVERLVAGDAPDQITVGITGDGSFLARGERYVLFLDRIGAAGSPYGVVGGADGRFHLSGGMVTKHCPDYARGVADVPATGPGQGGPAEGFLAAVKKTL